MEEFLQEILISEVNKANYINYGYLIGKNKKSVYKLKSALYDNQLNPLIIIDADRENAIFTKVLQSEFHRFLKIANEFNFRKVNLSSHSINEVKWLFGDGWPSN